MSKKRTSFKIKKWSKDDDATLIEMYKNPNVKIKDIQEVLNRTESSISCRAHVLKLKKVSFRDIETNSDEKACRSCGIIKKLNEFYKHKGMKDGLNTWCKECCKESKNKYLLRQASKKVENDLTVKKNYINQQKGKVFICNGCKRELSIDDFHVSKKYNKYTRESKCKMCKSQYNYEYKYKKIEILGHT